MTTMDCDICGWNSCIVPVCFYTKRVLVVSYTLVEYLNPLSVEKLCLYQLAIPHLHWWQYYHGFIEKRESECPPLLNETVGQRIKISWPFTLPLKVYLCVTQYWLQAFKEILLNSIHHSMGVNVSKQNGMKHHSTALWDCGKTLNIDCSFTSNSKKGPSLEISWWLADLLTMVLIIF